MSREQEDSADDNPQDEVGDEPSLGSFDRMTDQFKAWTQRGEFLSGGDAEQDVADNEDSDPAEEGDTGIADQDGLDEQVPFRDWQGVGTV